MHNGQERAEGQSGEGRGDGVMRQSGCTTRGEMGIVRSYPGMKGQRSTQDDGCEGSGDERG